MEPRLSERDHVAWNGWVRAAMVNARSRQFRYRVDLAKRVSEECLRQHEKCAVMWSGGKDSTAMAHLVRVNLGADVLLVSEKDDLDFPGELAYVRRLADQWAARLKILTPEISPSDWVRDNASSLRPATDMHSRTAALSKACFYGVMERENSLHDAIFLGLRAAESIARKENRRARGNLYHRKAGYYVCTPVVDWSGLDVFAYLLSNEIEILPVYRCVGMFHAREPWQIRKSWWLPGEHSTRGGAAWLRHYYPSLYRKFRDWIPAAQGYT